MTMSHTRLAAALRAEVALLERNGASVDREPLRAALSWSFRHLNRNQKPLRKEQDSMDVPASCLNISDLVSEAAEF